MSSDHQRKKSLREYHIIYQPPISLGWIYPWERHPLPLIEKPCYPPCACEAISGSATTCSLFTQDTIGGGGVDFHHGSHSDDASDALPIGNRDPEKTSTNWIGKTLHTRHKFRQITTMHLLKTFYVQLIKFIHAISCSSINKISIFHLFFHPLKIQQQSMNQLKQIGSLWGVHIFTSSPHGIAPARPACHCRHKSICNACGWTWDFRTSGWWFWLALGWTKNKLNIFEYHIFRILILEYPWISLRILERSIFLIHYI